MPKGVHTNPNCQCASCRSKRRKLYSGSCFQKQYEIDKAELYDWYWNQGLTVYEIADKFGCDKNVILSRMEEYGIPTRGKDYITERLIAGGLERLKSIKGKTYEEIYGEKENIPKGLGLQPKPPIASKEELEELYLRQKLTKEQISERLGCSYYLVGVWLGNYGIPERSRSEVSKLIWQDEKHLRKRIANADKFSESCKRGWKKRRVRELANREMFYCTSCKQYHYNGSRIGKWHRQFARVD